MIEATLCGHRIVSNPFRAGRTMRVEVSLDGRAIGYLYRRHKVYWMSVAYGNAPKWALPFLDQAHWGSAPVDSLRITVTTVLTRALMLHLGLNGKCGKPATRLERGEEAVPQCYGCNCG